MSWDTFCLGHILLVSPRARDLERLTAVGETGVVLVLVQKLIRDEE